MKTNSSSLLAEYAQTDPQSFSREIARASVKKIGKILGELPAKLAANILSRLSPRTIIALQSANPEAFAAWLDQADTDDAKAVLLHLQKSRRRLLIKTLSNEMQRTAMRRFFSYPRHSIGRYASSEMLTVYETMVTSEVIELIKQQPPGIPIVILNEQNLYEGLLNPRKVLEGSADLPIKAYIDEADALIAEAALSEALDIPQWLDYSVLAVVDHEDHVLGVANRKRIALALKTAPEVEQSTDLITFAFNAYAKVFLSLINFIFSMRSRP